MFSTVSRSDPATRNKNIEEIAKKRELASANFKSLCASVFKKKRDVLPTKAAPPKKKVVKKQIEVEKKGEDYRVNKL
eukprot:CAMPEP_0202968572 /NCGR_PEP_ID=MMETSP1396-20130829/13920_1 /ASSEMBLY_ACC=CAM_ASM_000872 /TAXON_ID= /ORGANISM="Pseudokeronopsis sp., Strain Brazil" /LENGTH=76 /DNA_ID=CAMNT_0049695021 /DNA_START=476 /DNA_END=703 /DNA_ORIENTATION=-